ncbi:MAG TPA: TIGR02680 family protein [Pirellulales bacterium]|nr:TIGR02680 family protein [Pirellulales bacterium]
MSRLFFNDQVATGLPPAKRERWQPIRGGLLNLYLYDYEEFRYENGHLILRGNNGTGKSRVMALQLPFLFDGQLAASRVEPDGDPSKRMDWNLLMGRHNERLGYTWIEFGRRCDAGSNGRSGELPWPSSSNGNGDHRDTPYGRSQRFVTLGCGLSATSGSGMRDPWFFITDQRVGEDLFLQSEAGHALSRPALIEAIGDRGRVYTTAKEYRQAVDETLFGLGRQRYDAMVDLLIQLRKPQLSRQLDEKMLAGVLGEALPPPSEQMILDVAESFRGLESDRMELTRFRSACDGVDSFLKIYKQYAGIAARRRAADVRQSHNRYESASKALRQAEQGHAEALELLRSATAELSSLDIKRQELETQIETLRADPKMRSADALRQAEEDETQAFKDLQEAQHNATTASERLAQRKTAQSEARQQAEAQLRTTREICRRSAVTADACDMKSRHESAFARLTLQLDVSAAVRCDISAVKQELEDTTEKRLRALEQLRRLNVALSKAESELTLAKQGRDDAQRHVEQAVETERVAESHRQHAVEDFLESYEMWRRDSEELTMPPADDVAGSFEQWSQRIDEASPIAIAIRQAELNAREKVSDKRAQLQRDIETLVAERSEAEQLLEKLEQGLQEPPSLPIRADEVARTIRPGAPFWSLVDFSQIGSPGEQANIEAALEASGMLNAWVTVDGSVLTSDFSDVLLCAADVADLGVNKLGQVMKPDERRTAGARSVSDDVIVELLNRIGYGEQQSTAWIAADGRWRNGPLYGCCRKEEIQFIGLDAREGHRIRRIREVQAQLRRIDDDARELDLWRQALDERLLAIDRQVSSLPDDSAVRAAATGVKIAAQRLIELRKAFTAAEQAVVDRRTKAEAARKARDLDARDLGLFAWVDRLDELERQTGAYQRLLAELWPSINHFESLRAQCATATTAVAEAEKDAALFAATAHDHRARHGKAVQRLSTLRETIGLEASDILRELSAVAGLRDRTVNAIKEAQTKEKNAVGQLGRMDERIGSQRQIISQETERRRQSCVAFQQLCSMGLLQTAIGEAADDSPSAWSVSRTVEVARHAESALSQTDSDSAAWDRIQEAITTRIQDLNTALSQHSFTSMLATSDGLYQVTVPYQGRDRSIHELRDLLSEEVDQRQLILDEREREIIENHLIGEVAAKLHEQIHQAHRLVDKMNDEIQKRPMSTGMTLKFDWKPDEELSSGIVEMCKKLLAATGTWSPSERSAIGRYLQDHIKEVRHSRETGTWHEHLAEALDYRRWHRFWVMRKQETGWKRLTKKTHGTGSGGEKAVALTIPQFAAAAAHYSSARDDAPRLILLDEAFVGIDPDMRGKCMELISVFDLDFMLTSEIEWGCYAGLPGVAIHQLSTRRGFDAVFLTRWIWNGKQRVKDETDLPPAARPEH